MRSLNHNTIENDGEMMKQMRFSTIAPLILAYGFPFLVFAHTLNLLTTSGFQIGTYGVYWLSLTPVLLASPAFVLFLGIVAALSLRSQDRRTKWMGRGLIFLSIPAVLWFWLIAGLGSSPASTRYWHDHSYFEDGHVYHVMRRTAGETQIETYGVFQCDLTGVICRLDHEEK